MFMSSFIRKLSLRSFTFQEEDPKLLPEKKQDPKPLPEIKEEMISHDSRSDLERLPTEILFKIFGYGVNFSHLNQLNKNFYHLTKPLLLNISPNFIGQKKWEILGKSQKFNISNDIQKILSGPCPFSPNSCIERTHFIILIGKINGQFPKLNWPQKITNGIPVKISDTFPDIPALEKSYLCLVTEVSLPKIEKDEKMSKVAKELYTRLTGLEAVTLITMTQKYNNRYSLLDQPFFIKERNNKTNQSFIVKESKDKITIEARGEFSGPLAYEKQLIARRIPLE